MDSIPVIPILGALFGAAISMLIRWLFETKHFPDRARTWLAALFILSIVGVLFYLATTFFQLGDPAGIGIAMGLLLGVPILLLLTIVLRKRSKQ